MEKMTKLCLIPVFLLLAVSQLIMVVSSSSEEILQLCRTNLTQDDGRGICVSFNEKLKNCPPLLTFLREKNFVGLQQELCSDSGASFESSWVCCPIREFAPLPPRGAMNFREHPNFHLLPSPDNSFCGESVNTDRIIGGEDAFPGEFPWMARIAMLREGDDHDQFTCGGTIISSRHILSAAHCFKDDDLTISKVRLGDTHDDNEVECVDFGSGDKICQAEEDYEVEEVIMHPEYTGDTGSQHDIALLRLKTPIRNISSLFIRPICLPFVNEFQLTPLYIEGDNGVQGVSGSSRSQVIKPIVSGWGKMFNSDTEGSTDLQYVRVPVTTNAECGKVYKPNNVTISDHQICAGGDKGKGSCAGDSGGPLFYPSKLKLKSRVRNFQVGIVSYGKSQCALANAPVVYTRVGKYLKFILDNLKE